MKKVFLVSAILLVTAACNKQPAPSAQNNTPAPAATPAPTPAPVTNAHLGWKTYSSAQYGFSFEYPAGLVSITPYTGDLLTFDGNDGAFGVTVYPGIFDPKTDSKVQQGVEQIATFVGQVKAGNNVGYEYSIGGEGCAANIIYVQAGAKNHLGFFATNCQGQPSTGTAAAYDNLKDIFSTLTITAGK